jgi:hypothetical protein
VSHEPNLILQATRLEKEIHYFARLNPGNAIGSLDR